MSKTTYTPPTDKLLTFGKAEAVDWDQWPNYLELGLSLEHVPELIRMATDLELRGREINRRRRRGSRILGTCTRTASVRSTSG